MTALYIISGILLLLILLISAILFSDFSVILTTEGKKVRLTLKTLGYSFDVPLEKEKKKKPKKEEQQPKDENGVMEKLLNMRNNFTRKKKAIELVIIYLRKRIEIAKFGVMGEIGTGNAATTGMVYGTLNAFVNGVFGFLGQYFSLKNAPDVKIGLNYDKAVLNLKFAFMVKTKPWYLLKALLIYRNNTK